MYAYVMRPLTLPKSYNYFIVSTSPVDRVAQRAVQANCRGLPVDATALSKWWLESSTKMGGRIHAAHRATGTASLITAINATHLKVD